MAGNIIPCLMFEYYKAFDSFNKCDCSSRLLSIRGVDLNICTTIMVSNNVYTFAIHNFRIKQGLANQDDITMAKDRV